MFRLFTYSPSRFNTSKTPISPITFFQQGDSRNLIPQQGCSRLLSPEGVISTPGLGQIVHRRIMHIPHSHFKRESKSELSNYLSSPSGSQRSFNKVPWFSKKVPSRGYSNKTKDHQQSQYLHVQMTSRDLFSQLEA